MDVTGEVVMAGDAAEQASVAGPAAEGKRGVAVSRDLVAMDVAAMEVVAMEEEVREATE